MKLTRLELILCILSGLLVSLSFSAHHMFWLIWIGFIPYFYVLFQLKQHWKPYFKASFFFGMTFYIGLLHWLIELHPLTWLPGVTIPLSLFIVYGGVLFISILVSCWIWLFGVLLAWLKPEGYQQFLYPVFLWMIIEWLQGLGDVSLPWGRLAISQYQNLALLQITQYTGAIFIGGLIIAINASLSLSLIEYKQKKIPLFKLNTFRYFICTTCLVLIVSCWGYLNLNTINAESRAGFKASIVQGNISQAEKWSTIDEYWVSIRKIMDKYLNLTIEVASREQPDLIVWPESAIPVPLKLLRGTTNDWVEQELKDLANGTKADLFTGIFDMNKKTRQIYNSAVMINQKGQLEGWYYKRQLVPFGEFMPYRQIIANIPGLSQLVDMINPLKGDTAKGLTPGNIDHKLGNLGTLICFESVYPHVSRESVLAGAEVLIIVTNDGWYRDAIAIHQHKAHAILRAIENNRYIIRAGNTGVSTIISNKGIIESVAPIMTATTLTGKVVPHSKMTVYTLYGEWVVYLSLITMAGLILFSFGRTNRIVDENLS